MKTAKSPFVGIFILIALAASAKCNIFEDVINSALNLSPHLEAYRTLMSGTKEDNPSNMSPEYVEQLKRVFRFVDWRGTAMEDILDHGGIPADLSILSGFNLNEILFSIENNPEVQQMLLDRIWGFSEDTDSNDQFYASKWNNTDEAEYEECRKDYSFLAGYRTTRILERVLLALLSGIADFQDPICEAICPAICGLINTPPPPIAVCIASCELACKSYNGPIPIQLNRTIEEILDEILPDYPQSRWAAKMIDAMAKIPSGLSDANLMWTGSYLMCNDILDSYNYTNLTTGEILEQDRRIQGKYCRLPFQPEPFKNSSVLYLYFGACVPDTCKPEHIERYLYEDNVVFRLLLSVILDWDLRTQSIFCDYVTDYPNDIPVQVAIGIIVTLIIICTLATIYDMHLRVPCLQKQFQEEADLFAAAERASEASYENPAYETLTFPVKSIGGYTHVDEHDYATYSRLGNMNHNNNQVGIENTNNCNSGAVLKHSVSTDSQRPLHAGAFSYESQADTLDNKPTFHDRLEVAFVGFSCYNTMRKIFKISRPEGYLSTVDFVRFLSFLYVLMGHTWLYGPVYNESWCSANLISALMYYPKQFLFQPIINFHLAGDSFFVISGLLTAYHWLRKYDKGREPLTWKGIACFYLYRYWTLMATMMLVLMFYTTSYKYLSGGPLAPSDVGDAEYCRTSWWANLLMVHNLVKTDEMCLTWVWYVPCLFQLHIIAPLILIPLIIFPLLGYGALILVYIAHIICTAVISADIYDEDVLTGRWFTDYLLTPWCRAGPYLIGMALGIIFHENRLKCEMKSSIKYIASAFALFLLFAPAYGTYTRFSDGVINGDWTKGAQVMWDTFSRSAWALGVCWFIFIGCTNNAGVLGDWMNHRMHQPFGKMVYCSWLFHSLMVFANIYSQQTPIYITWQKILQTYCSNVCICLFVGVVFVALIFHYPVALGLAKACLVRTKRECIEAGNHPDPLPEFSTLYGDPVPTVSVPSKPGFRKGDTESTTNL